MEVSNSKIKAWRRCHKMFHYKYNEKIEKKKPEAPLIKGKIIHEIIETSLNGGDWKEVLDDYHKVYKNLFLEEQEVYGNLIEELTQIMEQYFQYYQDDLEYLEGEGGKKAEFNFELPLTDGLVFEGVVDSVGRDDQGRVWLVERKTFKKNIPSETVRFTDVQTSLYYWALPSFGFPQPDGILWDYIRTKPPAIPQVLKSGRLSQRENIDTTREVYYQAIVDNGEDPEHYAKILNLLEGREDRFYRRIYLPAPDPIVQQIIADLKQTALEIKHLGDTASARNITRDCDWCSYYSLCQAELRGLDVEFIREREYKPRKEEYSDEDSQT